MLSNGGVLKKRRKPAVISVLQQQTPNHVSVAGDSAFLTSDKTQQFA